MSFLRFQNARGLASFSLLNTTSTFRFILGSHYYYVPTILADFLSPAVAEMHMADPTLQFFVLSDVNDDRCEFELFMDLLSGRSIEITQANCFFLHAVASRLMNDEIIEAVSEYSNITFPITIENATSRLNQKVLVGINTDCEIEFISANLWRINPNYLFQLALDHLQMILCHPSLKILSEDWLFHLIIDLIQKNGTDFKILYNYISFKDLDLKVVKKFVEEEEDFNSFDGTILRSIQQKLISINDKSRNVKTKPLHKAAEKSEFRSIYLKSSNEQNFNSEYFKNFYNEEPFFYYGGDNEEASQRKQWFENIGKEMIDNYRNTNIFTGRFGINPLKPKPENGFPDYFSKIKKNSNDETPIEPPKVKREAMIFEDYKSLSSRSLSLGLDQKSSQIPINFIIGNDSNALNDNQESDSKIFQSFFQKRNEVKNNNQINNNSDKTDFYELDHKSNSSSASSDDNLLIPPESINYSIKPEPLSQFSNENLYDNQEDTLFQEYETETNIIEPEPEKFQGKSEKMQKTDDDDDDKDEMDGYEGVLDDQY